MAKSLSEIKGDKFSTDSYNLDNYNAKYLPKITSYTKKIQQDIKNVAQAISKCVMVEGRWYDDIASEFAIWWNDVAGQSDGIDKLNGISSYIETIFKITALDLSKAISINDTTKKSANKYYGEITKYAAKANAGLPAFGVENITKKKLGMVEKTVVQSGKTISADKAAISAMINEVGNALEDINKQIVSVKKLIQTYIIEGAAIKITGFDQSTLDTYVKRTKQRLDAIQDELYVRLLEDSNRHNISSQNLKAALKKDYGVK